MPDSSGVSGTVSSFVASRSSVLALWWVALHLLLWSSVLAATRGFAPGLAALAILAVHAALRFPESRVRLGRSGDGRWSIPARGLYDLNLGSGTCFSSAWVLLELVSDDRRLRLLLLRDQFGDRDWRRLQVAVREPGPDPAE